MDRPDRFIVSCTPGPERVAQLRRTCAAHLRLWGIGACIETATLLLSELVTNAVRYGEATRSPFLYLTGRVKYASTSATALLPVPK